MLDIVKKAAQIKLVVFDVDGVLTDGSLYLTDDNVEVKAFNSRDGLGIKMLQQAGVDIAIITGRTSSVVEQRMTGLGIKHVYQGETVKLPVFNTLIQRLKISAVETAYVGDDIVDLPVMRRVGFAVAVNDAHHLVKKYADWQTPHNGGRGAARDVCEFILSAQNKLDNLYASYL